MIRWALFLLPLACAAQSVVMEGGAFRIAGWQPGPEPAAGWNSLLQVYAGVGDVPPLGGRYSVENGALTFRPRYPLAPGVRVRTVFEAKEWTFEIPAVAPPASTTRVANVYPTASVLPENELKLYVVFTAPMEAGEAWTHIHLMDESGKRVDLPFLEIDQELWNPDHTRLTVLFDPGRIKRGLLPLREVGPSIQEGHAYTLVIDRDWKDARGAALAEPYRKPFRVGPADRVPIDAKKWRLTVPRAGTRDPLAIAFGEPLDSAMLQHAIVIAGVEGAIELGPEEREWRFTPRDPWRAADHRIEIQTALEDLAGNRVGRAFDVDVFEKVTRQIPRDTVTLTFRPR